MSGKPTCMHNERGYFVGCLLVGAIERLSVEFYSTKANCLLAIRQRSWTRRKALIH